jgi:hypothetical protein
VGSGARRGEKRTARVRMVLMASSSTFPYGMMGRLFGGGDGEEGRAGLGVYREWDARMP